MLQLLRNFSTKLNTTTVLNIRISVLYVCPDFSSHHPALTLSKTTWLTILRNFIRKIPSFHSRYTDALAPTYNSICTSLVPGPQPGTLIERQGILIEYTMTIAGFERIADFFPNGKFAGMRHEDLLSLLRSTKVDLPYGGDLEFLGLIAYLRGTRKVHERMDLREASAMASEVNAHFPPHGSNANQVDSEASKTASKSSSFTSAQGLVRSMKLSAALGINVISKAWYSNVRSLASLVKLAFIPVRFIFTGITFNALGVSLLSFNILPISMPFYDSSLGLFDGALGLGSSMALYGFQLADSLGSIFYPFTVISFILKSACSSILLVVFTITIPVLLVVALTTLLERQVLASMQRRMGPQTSGIGGLLQPFYDGLKLGIKEPILPELSASGAFSVAPMIAFILSQVSFAIIFISDSSYQGIILMALSSLAVYGVLLAGWASNSKYALLGALRSVALMVSYELGFGAVLLSICLFLTDGTGMKSLNFADAPSFMQLALLPLLIIFLITILAESKRIPFDLPEAEAELVAGFNVEYSSLGFALFFVAEYANLTILSAIASIYFLGGFSALKIITLIFGFVWVRGTLPRYRADSFMRLGWKALLPLSLSLFGFYAAFDYIF